MQTPLYNLTFLSIETKQLFIVDRRHPKNV